MIRDISWGERERSELVVEERESLEEVEDMSVFADGF
jgi:hypothetical protein